MKWLGIGAILLVVLGAVGAFLATPWLALDDLRKAARAGDAAQLEQKVDFEAVRTSLRDQLQARFEVELGALGDRSNPLGAALAEALGPRIIQSAVDTMVTPEAVANMLRAADAGAQDVVADSLPAGEGASTPADTAANPPADSAEVKMDVSYRNFDLVAARFSRADGRGEPMTLLLRREGLIGWTLVAFELPPNPRVVAAQQEAQAAAERARQSERAAAEEQAAQQQAADQAAPDAQPAPAMPPASPVPVTP